MSIVLFDITALLYLVSTFIYIAYLISHRTKLAAYGRYVLSAGFVLHTVVMIHRLILVGTTPATSFHESLTFFAWFVVGVYLFVYYKYKLSVLGAFVTPFAFIFMVTASLMPREIIPMAPGLKSYWLPFHITIAFLGNAFFAVACFMAIMYIIQDRYLKRRKLKGLYFLLPSLEVLDEMGYRFVTYGFTLLTLAMITGAIWSEYALGSYWEWKHRQIFSLVVWLLYAALLHGRLTSGWRGRKAAVLSCVAFCLLISSYVIINVLAGGAHGLLR